MSAPSPAGERAPAPAATNRSPAATDRAPAATVQSPAAFVRSEIRALRAYSLDLAPARFKLDQNEMPWDPPRRVKEELARRLASRGWARYPDFHADRLRERLAARHGATRDGVLVGNGSNELLQAALLALGGPGVEVVGLAPSFSLYPRFALASGAAYRALDPRADLALPLDAVDEAIARDPRRPLLVCSPNNPTGEAIPAARVERWLAALEAPLLVDGAYAEFGGDDFRPLLARHRHLVLFGTFSKAWSLAGLRLGYLLADPTFVAEVVKVKLPYNLGHAAALAGELVLDEEAAVGRRVRAVVGRRPAWREMLARHFAEVFPSSANFVLVRDDERRKARALAALEARGIRVRDVSAGEGLAGCLRFTIGPGAALRAVDEALTEAGREG